MHKLAPYINFFTGLFILVVIAPEVRGNIFSFIWVIISLSICLNAICEINADFYENSN